MIANSQPSTRQGSVQINGVSIAISQSAATCQFTINPGARTMPAAGGDTAVEVAAMTGCTWTAASDSPWVRITGGGNGNGNGAVTMSVTANTGAARSAAIAIAGQIVTVSQDAASAPPGCTYALSSNGQTIPAAGGPATPVSVTTVSGCSWAAGSNVGWITISGPASGSGSGTVSFNVAANPGPERTGVVTIAGRAHTITQSGTDPSTCAFTVNPTSGAAGANGGIVGPISVSTTAGCTWASSSNASWITFATGPSGTGPGAVSLAIGTNTGAFRTGTATIAGKTFTVSQDAVTVCSFSINPASGSINALGGNVGTVAVTTTSGCTWTATSNASWITVTSGASGSGSGTVGLSAALNVGGQRTGTVTIAGQTFTLVQAATLPSCTFSINPTSQNPGAGAGNGSTSVSTQAGCTWTAVSNNSSWLTISSGASGTGNGTVAFTIAANVGPARTGTLTVAGQTFTVNQASGCNFAINPTSRSVSEEATTGTVALTGSSACSWTAVSNTPTWLTVTNGASGNGNGTISYAVATNNTNQNRDGTITIAGLTFNVNQKKK